MKGIAENIFLFAFGGAVYYCIELLFRGFSHPTMFVLGGICFVLCGVLSHAAPENTGLLGKMFLCAIMITTLELLFGYIFNIKLGMHIWNYDSHTVNFKGQICLVFSVLWYALSGIAIIAGDYMRYYLYGGVKPCYKMIGERT